MQKKQKKATAKQVPLTAAYEKALATRPQAHEPEVMPAGSPAAVAADSRDRANSILGQVRQDIDNAELGRFFALRAGVGLIVVKELCAHGEFMGEALRMIPNRTPRTLRRYMDEARGFLDAKALMAHDAWLPLSQVGSRSGRLLGPGGGEDLPQPASDLADWLAAKDAEKKQKEQAAPRPLSSAEKRKAAADLWTGIAGRVTDEGIARQTWQILDQETLETCASALRTVADKMMAAARKAKNGKI